MHGHLILASTAISGQALCPQSCQEVASRGYVLCLHKRGWEQGASSCGSQPGPLDDYSGVSIHQLIILVGDRKKFQCLKHPLIRVILITRNCGREDREIVT
ncbi:unnamed protein product [Pipistrellus nathusii]|uniref:Uncharacterized protein n=1 Tax=Pipistrellus nathusii TaxID=59473 RepID=A0ABN9ZUY8_PIPNA